MPIPLPPGYVSPPSAEAEQRLTQLYPQLPAVSARLLTACRNALAELNYTAGHPQIRQELQAAIHAATQQRATVH